MCRSLREQFADLDAAPAVLLELEWGGEGGPGRAFGREVAGGELLAVVFLQLRLRVEGVDLARTAVEIDVDDVPGLGRKVRLPGRERVDRRRGEEAGVGEDPRQSEHAEPGAGAGEPFATRERGHVAS